MPQLELAYVVNVIAYEFFKSNFSPIKEKMDDFMLHLVSNKRLDRETEVRTGIFKSKTRINKNLPELCVIHVFFDVVDAVIFLFVANRSNMKPNCNGRKLDKIGLRVLKSNKL